MFYDFKICYDRNTNILTFQKNNHNPLVQKIQGKYGIEIGCDINETPIFISIPDPDVLFGLKKEYLLKLTCNNLT